MEDTEAPTRMHTHADPGCEPGRTPAEPGLVVERARECPSSEDEKLCCPRTPAPPKYPRARLRWPRGYARPERVGRGRTQREERAKCTGLHVRKSLIQERSAHAETPPAAGHGERESGDGPAPHRRPTAETNAPESPARSGTRSARKARHRTPERGAYTPAANPGPLKRPPCESRDSSHHLKAAARTRRARLAGQAFSYTNGTAAAMRTVPEDAGAASKDRPDDGSTPQGTRGTG